MDGHYSEENIAARKSFLEKYKSFHDRSFYFTPGGESVDEFENVLFRNDFGVFGGVLKADFPLPLRPTIIYSHDESAFNSDEGQTFFWGLEGQTGIAKKSKGGE